MNDYTVYSGLYGNSNVSEEAKLRGLLVKERMEKGQITYKLNRAEKKLKEKEKQCELLEEQLDSLKFKMISDINISQTFLEGAVLYSVCHYYGLSFKEISRPTRKREIVKARQVAMYFLKKYSKKSLASIGAIFKKDHATVLHSCRVVAEDMKSDKFYRNEIKHINEKIQQRKSEIEAEAESAENEEHGHLDERHADVKNTLLPSQDMGLLQA